ncbi:response regulator transcription factor [Hymenobacter koreensis]|uniref:Response regulator transcription factor n=1 Tax=Hymenobacter koreensis TaxID=1084523 RepID=A0ABP8JIT2_9BACT
MSAPDAHVLVAAPPTLHRQGLVTTLRDAWPGATLTVTADVQYLPVLLLHQPYALVVVDGSLCAAPLPRLLATLRGTRTHQPLLLLLVGNRLPPAVREALLRAEATTLLSRHASPADVVSAAAPWLSGRLTGSLTTFHTPTRRATPPTPFSRRELEVLRLVVADCCNQEIADRLFLSVRTVESHRRALLQKAGAKTLVGLVVRAVREGWVTA